MWRGDLPNLAQSVVICFREVRLSLVLHQDEVGVFCRHANRHQYIDRQLGRVSCHFLIWETGNLDLG